nr:hypothetical protein [Achromobacter denitrificans]
MAVRVMVPAPIWLTVPLPEITPAKLTASDRLNTSVPLLATFPTMTPEVPPLPSCSVPPAMVVPPV